MALIAGLEEPIPASVLDGAEIPQATYSLGDTTFPVCPTGPACGAKPSSTALRDAPTAPAQQAGQPS